MADVNQDNFDFAPAYDPALSQYHTPPKLAVQMAELLPHPEEARLQVLEPSAGGGNLVRAAFDARRCGVTAIEIDPKWISHLGGRFELHREHTRIVNADFLDVEYFNPMLDAVLMNPPLDGGVGVLHVKHALTMAPVVITVLRGQDLHGVKRYEQFWSTWGPFVNYLAFCPQRPFRGALSDFVVVRFDQDSERDSPELAWWR